MRGPSSLAYLLGEPFTDPSACCIDQYQQLLKVATVQGSFNLGNPGSYTALYACSANNTNVAVDTKQRVVKVNFPPTISLIGPSFLKLTLNTAFLDQGATCLDMEDGLISTWGTSSGLGSMQMLQIRRAGASSVLQGAVEDAFDGNLGGTTASDCQSCVKVAGGSALWLDFGGAKVVSYVLVHGMLGKARIRVGHTTSPTGNICAQGRTVSRDGTGVNMTCAFAMAGRFMTIEDTSNNDFLVCEVIATGTMGPAAPGRFDVEVKPGGCTGLSNATYALSGANDLGAMYRESGSGWSILRQAVPGMLAGTPNADIWVLMSSGGVVQATAPGGMNFPPISGWSITGSGITCTSMTLRLASEDGCPWLQGHTNVNGTFRCGNGMYCKTDGCCGAANGWVAQCPMDRPFMCALRSCSGDNCCRATSCTSDGGPRPCIQSSLDGPVNNAATRIEVASSVLTTVDGNFTVVYTCVDSLGATAIATRAVTTSCEDPNPGGQNGGNRAVCNRTVGADKAAPDWQTCATLCIRAVPASSCEVYQFFTATSTCQFLVDCTGRYTSFGVGETDDRQVGYCRRVKPPPRMSLSAGNNIVLLGQAWAEPPCRCSSDADAGIPDVCASTKNSVLNVNVPGLYTIGYTCTDFSNQITTGQRLVIVKDRCTLGAVSNSNPNGACAEGAGPWSYGSTCTTRCATNYVPATPVSTCTTATDVQLVPDWTPVPPRCGAIPCDEPVGILSTAIFPDGKARPCVESDGSGKIPDGGLCTPNCNDKYVLAPKGLVLSCNQTKLTPSSFSCYLPAAPPSAVIANNPGAVDATIFWLPGSANDCQFSRWILQGQRQANKGEVQEPFSTLTGCEDYRFYGNRAAVASTGCKAVNLVEGGVYLFRVMEICTNTDLNSAWTTSPLITLRFVFPPAIKLRVPDEAGMVVIDPQQILALLTVNVELLVKPGVYTNLTQFGSSRCPNKQIITQSKDIVLRSPTAPNSVGLSSGLVLMVLPEKGWFETGCRYNWTIAPGLFTTVEKPTKPNPIFTWNFTFVDVPPTQTRLQVISQVMLSDGVAVQFAVLFDAPTEFNCTVFPDNWKEIPLFAVGRDAEPTGQQATGGGWVGPKYGNVPNRTVGPFRQATSSITAVTSFTITGLVPFKQYKVICPGYKDGKPWVAAVCDNSPICPPTPFQTMKDVTNNLSAVQIDTWADCPPGRLMPMDDPVNRSQTQLALGAVLLVAQYEAQCLPPQTKLPTGAIADMRLHAKPILFSAYASLQWIQGPWVLFKYVKGNPADPPVILKADLVFQVCSHSQQMFPTNYDCAQYTMTVTCVDSSIKVSTIQILQGRRLERYDSLGGVAVRGVERRMVAVTQQVTLDVGTPVQMLMDTEDNFNLSTIAVTLGVPSDGFPQAITYSGRNVNFNANGIGLNLPLMITWMGVDFDMGYSISFTPPRMSMISRTFPLIRAEGTTAPFAEVALKPMPVPIAGYPFTALAPVYIRLQVVKASAGAAAEDMCQGSQRWTGWSSVTCDLQAAALSDLVVQLYLRDFRGGGWGLSPVQLANAVAFEPPRADAIYRIDPATGKNAPGPPVLLSYFTSISASLGVLPQVFLAGSGFPLLEEINLKGSAVNGYQLFLQSDDGTFEAPLCKSLTRVSSVLLTCLLARCVDARQLSLKPRVVLQLGDLRWQPLLGQVELPKPVVDSVFPPTTPEVGDNLFSFTGKGFGMPIDGPLNLSSLAFQTMCVQFEANRTFGTGYLQLFAPPNVTVGLSRCQVVFQNDSIINCTTSTPLRKPRGAPVPGFPQGKIEPLQAVKSAIMLGKDVAADAPPTIVSTLSTCPTGYRRVREDGILCERCPPGMYSVAGLEPSPLQCTACPPGSFQDAPGKSSCVACPENTRAIPPARSVQDCTCLPGYYSRVWNSAGTSGLPGYACSPCTSDDLLAPVPKGQGNCGVEVQLATSCTELETPTCVPLTPGGFDYQMCKVSCPGGTVLPRSKPSFYVTAGKAVVATVTTDTEYKPVAVLCAPADACAGNNECSLGYTGLACQVCVFGYYREKLSNTCMQCDSSQIIGTLIMVGVAVVLSVGAFFGSLLYLKCLADPIFTAQIKGFIARALTSGKVGGLDIKDIVDKIKYRTEKITFTKRDVGVYWEYVKNNDLGMVYRVDDEKGIVWVAGVRKGSPAQAKGIASSWQMLVVNGSRLKGQDEAEVLFKLREQKMPLVITFRAPRFQVKVDEDVMDAAQQAANTSIRVITMSLGVLQSFNAVARMDLSWPPLFTRVSAIVQQMMLNFDFFHPECSVAAPYEQKWVVFAAAPYLVIIPLSLSFVIIAGLALYSSRDDPEFRTVQFWLLKNAWCRAALSILLLFIQNHMDQLISPFICVSRDDGSSVMKLAQDIPCDTGNKRYFFVFTVATFGWSMLAAIFSTLILCVYKSYYWQVGTQHRVSIPSYVALVDMSTQGMRGFYPTVRERIFSNVVAVKTYPKQDFAHIKARNEQFMAKLRRKQEDEDEFGNKAPTGVPLQVIEFSLPGQPKRLARILAVRPEEQDPNGTHLLQYVDAGPGPTFVWVVLDESRLLVVRDRNGEIGVNYGPKDMAYVPTAEVQAAVAAFEKQEKEAAAAREAAKEDANRVVSCAERWPELGDVVVSRVGNMCGRDAAGRFDAWTLMAGEWGMIVETDGSGDFRLRKADGQESNWQMKRCFVYVKALTLRRLVGYWSVVGDEGSIWEIQDGGRSLLNGKHLGEARDFVQDPLGPEMGIRRHDGWSVDLDLSTSHLLVLHMEGFPQKRWRRVDTSLFDLIDTASKREVNRKDWIHAFDLLDGGRKGKITKEDWKKQRLCEADFERCDVSGDGVISREEWREAAVRFDWNKDGTITLLEWLRRDQPKGAEQGVLAKLLHALDDDGDGQLTQEDWQRGFQHLDRSKQGKVTLKDWLSWNLKKALFEEVDRNQNSYVTQEEWDSSFALLDKNGEGHISLEAMELFCEFPDPSLLKEAELVASTLIAATAAVPGSAAAGQRKKMCKILADAPEVFALLDLTPDGMITRQEWARGFENLSGDAKTAGKISLEDWSRLHLAQPLFEELDRNKNGWISKEEWRSAFDLFDVNGDGRVSVEEMRAHVVDDDDAVVHKATDPPAHATTITARQGRPLETVKTVPGGSTDAPKVFKLLDLSHDGVITRQEWIRGFENLSKNAKVAGKLSREDWCRHHFLLPLFEELDRNKDGWVGKEEWRLAFDRFDSNGDGRISVEELKARLVDSSEEAQASVVDDEPVGHQATTTSARGGTSSAAPGRTRLQTAKTALPEGLADAPEVFNILDLSRDGMITRQEWMRGFEGLSKNAKNLGKLSREDWRRHRFLLPLFEELDRNKDGRLGKEEWRAAFDLFDSNGDGRISVEELKARLVDSSEEMKASVADDEPVGHQATTLAARGATSSVAPGRTRLQTAKTALPEGLADAPEVFNILDLSRDGVITRQEWIRGFEGLSKNAKNIGKLSREDWCRHRFLTPLFEELDRNKDGWLGKEEWRLAFDLFDSNGDGRISVEELKARLVDSSDQDMAAGVDDDEPVGYQVTDVSRVTTITTSPGRGRLETMKAPPSTEAPEVFNILDLSRDGMITRQEWIRGFENLSKTAKEVGKLSREDWCRHQFLQPLFEELDRNKDGWVGKEEWRLAFDLFDCNGDGRISVEELKARLVEMADKATCELSGKEKSRDGRVSPEALAKVPKVFNLLDLTPDGLITRQEWLRGFEKLSKTAKDLGKMAREDWCQHHLDLALFEELDRNKDGWLSKDEWRLAFSLFDANGDGRVAVEEMRARLVDDPDDMLPVKESATGETGETELPPSTVAQSSETLPSASALEESATGSAQRPSQRGPSTPAPVAGEAWSLAKVFNFATETKADEPGELRIRPGDTVVASLAVSKECLKAKDAFRAKGSIRWPDELQGNMLTYGWVILINTFCRQFSLILSVAMGSTFPPLGAAGQSFIFMCNFALVMVVFPYEANMLNVQESLMIGCLATLCWAGSFRSMLQDNIRAQDHPTTIARIGTMIDVLTVIILIIVGTTMMYNARMIIGSLLAGSSEENLLNLAYFKRKIMLERAMKSEADSRYAQAHLVQKERDMEDELERWQSSVAVVAVTEVNTLNRANDATTQEGQDMQDLVLRILRPYLPRDQIKLASAMKFVASPTAPQSRVTTKALPIDDRVQPTSQFLPAEPQSLPETMALGMAPEEAQENPASELPQEDMGFGEREKVAPDSDERTSEIIAVEGTETLTLAEVKPVLSPPSRPKVAIPGTNKQAAPVRRSGIMTASPAVMRARPKGNLAMEKELGPTSLPVKDGTKEREKVALPSTSKSVVVGTPVRPSGTATANRAVPPRPTGMLTAKKEGPSVLQQEEGISEREKVASPGTDDHVVLETAPETVPVRTPGIATVGPAAFQRPKTAVSQRPKGAQTLEKDRGPSNIHQEEGFSEREKVGSPGTDDHVVLETVPETAPVRTSGTAKVGTAAFERPKTAVFQRPKGTQTLEKGAGTKSTKALHLQSPQATASKGAKTLHKESPHHHGDQAMISRATKTLQEQGFAHHNDDEGAPAKASPAPHHHQSLQNHHDDQEQHTQGAEDSTEVDREGAPTRSATPVHHHSHHHHLAARILAADDGGIDF